MLKTLRAAVAVAALAGSALSAQAGLVGSTVNVTFYYPNSTSLYCDSGNQVVGAAVEYAEGCSGFDAVGIDFTDTGFIVTHSNLAGFSSGAFNGFVVDVLSGLDFDTVSYVGGSLGVTSASVIGGDLYINFADQGSGRAEFSFTQTQGVPEPASLALVGLGLLAAGAARRARRA